MSCMIIGPGQISTQRRQVREAEKLAMVESWRQTIHSGDSAPASTQSQVVAAQGI